MKYIKKIIILIIIIILGVLLMLSSCVKKAEKYNYSIFTLDEGISLISEDIAVTYNETLGQTEINTIYNFHTENNTTATFYLPYIYNSNNLIDTKMSMGGQRIRSIQYMSNEIFSEYLVNKSYDKYYQDFINRIEYFSQIAEFNGNSIDFDGYCYKVEDSYLDYLTSEGENATIILNKSEGTRNLVTLGVDFESESEDKILYSLRYSPDFAYFFVIGDDITGIECNVILPENIYERTEITLKEYIRMIAGSDKERYCYINLIYDNILDYLEGNEINTALENCDEDYDYYFHDGYSYYSILAYEIALTGGQADNLVNLSNILYSNYSDDYVSSTAVKKYNILPAPSKYYLNKGASRITVKTSDMPYLVDSNLEFKNDNNMFEADFDSSQELINFQVSQKMFPITFSFIVELIIISPFIIPVIAIFSGLIIRGIKKKNGITKNIINK